MKKFFCKRTTVIIALLAVFALSGCTGPGTSDKGTGDSGEAAGKPFPELTLLYNTSENHKKIAEAIADMWYKELGIKIQLSNAEWKVYLDKRDQLDYDIARAGWIGDYPDPNTFLDMWVTGGGQNKTGWSNEKYDSLIHAAAVELDPEKRMAILAEAEDLLINGGMPIIPIYYYVNKNVVQTYVKGMHYNLRDQHPLKYVYIEKDGKVLPPEEQVFTFNNGTEPETLDPALMTGDPEFNIATQLFEGLVEYDPETLEPLPAVAQSWEISDDGLTYTFHLRKDVYWSNGDPVTAHDFRYSWLRALSPETASDYAFQLYYVKNGEAYFKGEIDDPDKVGIKVIDDYTIQTILENPTAYWLDLLAFHTLMPVNRKCVEKYGSKWTRPENIITNGPFLLKEWVIKDRIIMVKNPDYYDADDVKLQKIIVYPIEDRTTDLNMFKAGETDWIRTILVTHIDEWMGRPELHITPFLTTYYYMINTTRPPLDDVRVRKALNLALDKKSLCEYVTRAGEKPADTFVPPGIHGYNPPDGPDYDPGKARQLLREAGFQASRPE